jgi:RNA polymerase sigma-70 factor (ECF subfamily)
MDYPAYNLSSNSQLPKIILEAEKLPDEKLVRSISSTGNNQLFEVIYNRYHRKVYQKCFRFVKNRDEAEDLMQDIFLKLFIKLHTFKGQSKFSTWLYAFIHNFCVNYVQRDLRKKTMSRLDALNDRYLYLLSTTPEEEELLDEEQLGLNIVQLKKAMDTLPAEDKAILLLKYHHDASVQKLEQILNIKKSAVKMRLKRAKIKLALAHHKLGADRG